MLFLGVFLLFLITVCEESRGRLSGGAIDKDKDGMVNHAHNINNGRINVEWISIRLTIVEPDGLGTVNGRACGKRYKATQFLVACANIASNERYFMLDSKNEYSSLLPFCFQQANRRLAIIS
jgi:hypothetical protein